MNFPTGKYVVISITAKLAIGIIKKLYRLYISNSHSSIIVFTNIPSIIRVIINDTTNDKVITVILYTYPNFFVNKTKLLFDTLEMNLIKRISVFG